MPRPSWMPSVSSFRSRATIRRCVCVCSRERAHARACVGMHFPRVFLRLSFILRLAWQSPRVYRVFFSDLSGLCRCLRAQVSAAIGSLLHDLNILLSWHQRCQALSAGKHQKTSHAGTSKSRGGGNVVKGGSTSSPRGSAFKRNPSLDIRLSPQGDSVEDRSAKKAKKS
jgi:hypothetical protein